MEGMEEFKDLFIQTARERIQQLNELLLKLENNPKELTIVEELMRTGHSLKGESAAMGYSHIAALGHVVEDLFTDIGAGKTEINKNIMDALFESIDHIEASIDNVASSPDGQDLDSTEYVEKLKKLTGLKTPAATPSPAQQSTEVKTSKVESKTTNKTDDKSPKTDKAKKNEKEGSKEEAKEETKEEGQKDSGTKSSTETSKPDAKKVNKAPKKPSKPSSDSKKSRQISTVTLKVSKLDKMVNISEELILLKMKLKNNDLVESDSRLKADIHLLDRLVTDMQFHIMQARLFPISLALQTVPRIVRDVSQKTGKNVKLVMEGQETTVDRTIIDHLTEPFVHMIRNSVDHGIESPEERKAAGKPDQGIVKISAYTKENKFYIDISDDGRGVEWDKLVASSIKKGVVDAETVAKWSLDQKKQLLFMDGVSASESITDISGRGVGMSAVQSAIKKLGGDIVVNTKVGEGTTFTLRLPLTLAIMESLLVRIGNQTFAIPSNEVVRSIQIKKENVKNTGTIPTIVVDEQSVSLIFMDDKFNLKNKPDKSSKPSKVESKPDSKLINAEDESNNNNKLKKSTVSDEELVKVESTVRKNINNLDRVNKFLTIVLIKRGVGMFGCVVDKIVAEEEILVKQLGPLLKKQSKYFSGATILADGSAAPIINIEGLVS